MKKKIQLLDLINGLATDDRRKSKRYLTEDVLEGYIVIDANSELEVSLIDISKGGISFSVNKAEDCRKPGEVIQLNVYFKGTDVAFQCSLTVIRVLQEDNGPFRHALQVVAGSDNEQALAALSEFIKIVKIVDEKRPA